MITRAKNIHHQSIHSYELQAIVGSKIPAPRWFEVLYRPKGTTQVESIFKHMSAIEKIEFDTQLFSLIPSLQEKHKNINLSINLSPLSLGNDEFLGCFNQLLSFNNIDCNQLCIEIIETDVLLPLKPLAHSLLKKFKMLGGLVALDDFGSGNTHWELLNLELVDIIKVASQNIKNKQHNKMFAAMAMFSKKLGLNCVLEGVENLEEFQFAKKIGYDYCQGWHFKSWKQSI